VVEIHYDARETPGALTATVRKDPFVQKYQVLFDYQQDQLVRLGRNTGVKAEALRAGVDVELRVEGSGALVLRVI
jgi:hypothetical protein